MWQGLGDIINTFRTHVLRIPSIPDRLGPGLTDRLKVPWTYCWSEGLLPRAKDWKRHIDVSGFYFLEDQKEFMPDGGLVEFLKGGKPPVYIG
jgi:sterol 3beta-glucosyltransferase